MVLGVYPSVDGVGILCGEKEREVHQVLWQRYRRGCQSAVLHQEDEVGYQEGVSSKTTKPQDALGLFK
jgi:hypothetical protein